MKLIEQATNLYAKPLNIPWVFAYNSGYIESRYLWNNKPLKINSEDVRQLVHLLYILEICQ